MITKLLPNPPSIHDLRDNDLKSQNSPHSLHASNVGHFHAPLRSLSGESSMTVPLKYDDNPSLPEGDFLDRRSLAGPQMWYPEEANDALMVMQNLDSEHSPTLQNFVSQNQLRIQAMQQGLQILHDMMTTHTGPDYRHIVDEVNLNIRESIGQVLDLWFAMHLNTSHSSPGSDSKLASQECMPKSDSSVVSHYSTNHESPGNATSSPLSTTSPAHHSGQLVPVQKVTSSSQRMVFNMPDVDIPAPQLFRTMQEAAAPDNVNIPVPHKFDTTQAAAPGNINHNLQSRASPVSAIIPIELQSPQRLEPGRGRGRQSDYVNGADMVRSMQARSDMRRPANDYFEQLGRAPQNMVTHPTLAQQNQQLRQTSVPLKSSNLNQHTGQQFAQSPLSVYDQNIIGHYRQQALRVSQESQYMPHQPRHPLQQPPSGSHELPNMAQQLPQTFQPMHAQQIQVNHRGQHMPQTNIAQGQGSDIQLSQIQQSQYQLQHEQQIDWKIQDKTSNQVNAGQSFMSGNIIGQIFATPQAYAKGQGLHLQAVHPAYR